MSVAEVLDRTAIADVVDVVEKTPLAPASRLDLGDWVRPRLMGGRPVLVVRRSEEMWVNADTRSK
jgi:hypothetical protein